jgi:hypothetical protein
MAGVERQERRLLPLLGGLLAFAFALALPAAVALRARPALDASIALSLAVVRELLVGAVDNPGFWGALGLALLWLFWLAWRGLGGRR